MHPGRCMHVLYSSPPYFLLPPFMLPPSSSFSSSSSFFLFVVFSSPLFCPTPCPVLHRITPSHHIAPDSHPRRDDTPAHPALSPRLASPAHRTGHIYILASSSQCIGCARACAVGSMPRAMYHVPGTLNHRALLQKLVLKKFKPTSPQMYKRRFAQTGPFASD